MKLTLKELQAAMAPLAEIGKGELTFEVGGVPVSLRALSPEEEIYIQRYARQAVSDGDYSDQASALEYLDRFRMSALGYSIVQVGDLDFRSVEFVETGEKLPNGTAIKIRKHEAVIQLLASWSRNMINAVFKKFSELANKVEAEVDGLIEFDEIDYDAEIARLEDRLKEVRDAKNKHQLSTKDPRTDLRKQVASSNRTLNQASQAETLREAEGQNTLEEESVSLAVPLDVDREIEDDFLSETEEEPEEDLDLEAGPVEHPALPEDEEVEEATETDEPPAPPPPVSRGRASVFDRAKGRLSPPPPREADTAPSPPPTPDRGAAELPPRFEDVPDSMLNTDDSDAMNRAIEEENLRLMRRRAQAAAPHLAARQVAESLEANNPAPVTQPVLSGKKDGLEVYRMPTQTISDRKAPTVSAASKAPKPTGNPKFRPVR